MSISAATKKPLGMYAGSSYREMARVEPFISGDFSSLPDDFSYVFSPVIGDNLMYVLARNQALVALDATTGQEVWVHENLQGIAPRGINYWESRDRTDRRLIYQRNHQLEALDALTGKPILTFGKDGAVNLLAQRAQH